MESISNDYAAGIAAGMAIVLVGHPFDTIKVKLQTQLGNGHGFERRGALWSSAHLFKTEGVKGFYRGATPSFVGVSVESALLFGSYSQIKSYYQAGDLNASLISTSVPAAILAGACVGTILCPSELVKCRLQVHAKGSAAGAQKYDGPLDCILKTVRTEGVQGMFRGLTATCLREAIGNACFFMTYETTRQYMLKNAGLDPVRSSSAGSKSHSQSAEESLSRSHWQNYLTEAAVGIVSGGLSGIAFWTAVLPIDLAKTRIQTAQDLTSSKNPLFQLRMIFKHQGIRGLYAGLGPTLTRAFPANAAAIFAWEGAARLLAG